MSRAQASRSRGRKSKADTGELIRRRAIDLFAARGYANTSLDDIAAAVGIQKPSLYHYIAQKEDLLYEINSLLVNELIDEAQALLSDADDPVDKVRAFFRAGMRLIHRRHREVTIFLGERNATKRRTKRWKDIEQKRDDYQHLFERILSEGISEGYFRDMPVTPMALGMLGTISWAYRWYDPRGGYGPDELADLFAEMILDGIKK
jgi:TetR/AcrR family transcriptional regulator, cholesterol catabolism regulator